MNPSTYDEIDSQLQRRPRGSWWACAVTPPHTTLGTDESDGRSFATMPSGDSRLSFWAAAATSDSQIYVVSIWFVRPVRVIGPSRVPMAVEETGSDPVKLNRQPHERSDAQGVGNGDSFRLRCQHPPRLAAFHHPHNSSRKVCWAERRSIKPHTSSSRIVSGPCTAPGRVMSARCQPARGRHPPAAAAE